MYGLDCPFAKMHLMYHSSNFSGPRLGCAAANAPRALMCPVYHARVPALHDIAASAWKHSAGQALPCCPSCSPFNLLSQPLFHRSVLLLVDAPPRRLFLPPILVPSLVVWAGKKPMFLAHRTMALKRVAARRHGSVRSVRAWLLFRAITFSVHSQRRSGRASSSRAQEFLQRAPKCPQSLPVDFPPPTAPQSSSPHTTCTRHVPQKPPLSIPGNPTRSRHNWTRWWV